MFIPHLIFRLNGHTTATSWCPVASDAVPFVHRVPCGLKLGDRSEYWIATFGKTISTVTTLEETTADTCECLTNWVEAAASSGEH